MSADATMVIEDIDILFPQLASSRPNIVEFMGEMVSARTIQELQTFPVIEQFPTTWASTDPWVDKWWADSVRDVPQLDDLQEWLDTQLKNHVKPFGSRDARMLCLSSYPTKADHSTVNSDYATVNDLFNICMYDLYTKLSCDRQRAYPASLGHIDIFPSRIDRNRIPGKGTDIFRSIPRTFRDYWRDCHIDFICNCATNELVLGDSLALQSAF